MGSLQHPKQDDDDNELTILVTGFQPFRSQYPVNPSWEICSTLPEYLPPSTKTTTTTTTTTPTTQPENGSGDGGGEEKPQPPRRVRILAHPDPVRVSYEAVRDLVPRLWGGERGPAGGVDLALHIGMAGPEAQYSLERRAHRDGYRMPDVDGRLLGDEERQRRQGDGWIWHGLPEILASDLDVDATFSRWVDKCPDLEGRARLRISDDPGRYLCDFIYYSSLAELTKAARPRHVAFLHVPADPALVDLGRDVAVRLLQSIVEVGLPRG